MVFKESKNRVVVEKVLNIFVFSCWKKTRHLKFLGRSYIFEIFKRPEKVLKISEICERSIIVAVIGKCCLNNMNSSIWKIRIKFGKTRRLFGNIKIYGKLSTNPDATPNRLTDLFKITIM